jgi:hypothetical protein
MFPPRAAVVAQDPQANVKRQQENWHKTKEKENGKSQVMRKENPPD